MDDMKAAIHSGGPIGVSIEVYEDFANYAGGVYIRQSGTKVGDMDVAVVGWGEDSGVPYWIVAASWGPYWGEEVCGGPWPKACA